MAANGLTFGDIEKSLKRAAATLKQAEIPFVLGGSLACWARGGPESTNDLDLFLRPEDAERALAVLVAEGMQAEQPPEDWLLKAWDGEVLVDLIFGPAGLELDDEVFARGERLRILGMNVDVLAIEDVITTKLMAIDERAIRYESLLQIARALREQIDWEAVRARTATSPFSRPFFVLMEDLGILGGESGHARRENTVRVIGAAEG
jgi:Nucleotidyl transferase of unknown function (DUF2204)